MESTTCDKCGQILVGGEWPFCPHPQMGQGVSVKTDDIPGGMVMENLGPHPITVYSHTERRRIMAERGLELKERFSPMPGTDIDPAGIPNPKGYVDAYTLAAGAELICRNGRGSIEEVRFFGGIAETLASGLVTNLVTGTLTDRDARAIEAGDPRRMARLGRRMAHGGK